MNQVPMTSVPSGPEGLVLGRREATGAILFGSLALLAAACLPGSSETSHLGPGITAVPQPGPNGNDNESVVSIIDKKGLQPVEFPDLDSGEKRVDMVTTYLRQYVAAVKEAPWLSRQPLSTHRIVDAANFPVGLAPSQSVEFALDQFVKAYADRRLPQEPQVEIFYDPDLIASTLGTQGAYELVEGFWVPRTKIRVGLGILGRGNRFEPGREDSTLTNGEVGVMLAHESGHWWQIQGLTNLLNADSQELRRVGDSPDAVSEWISQRSAREEQRVREIVQSHSPEFTQFLDNSSVVEAQGNALMFSFYESLKELNGGSRLSGMGVLDEPGNPRSLYGTYTTYVMGTPEGCLNPRWLALGGRQIE